MRKLRYVTAGVAVMIVGLMIAAAAPVSAGHSVVEARAALLLSYFDVTPSQQTYNGSAVTVSAAVNEIVPGTWSIYYGGSYTPKRVHTAKGVLKTTLAQMPIGMQGVWATFDTDRPDFRKVTTWQVSVFVYATTSIKVTRTAGEQRYLGTGVKLTAKVVAADAGPLPGIVAFSDGTRRLGTARIKQGSATFQLPNDIRPNRYDRLNAEFIPDSSYYRTSKVWLPTIRVLKTKTKVSVTSRKAGGTAKLSIKASRQLGAATSSYKPYPNSLVTIQIRTSTSGPWATLANKRLNSAGTGIYTTTTSKARYYRIVLPETATHLAAASATTRR